MFNKPILTLALAIVVLVGGVILYERRSAIDVPGYTPVVSNSKKPTTSPVAGSPKPTTTNNAATLSLQVPFTPQAPTGNWDQLHNEACEEVSSIMAAAYLSGDRRSKIPAAEVEEELAALTEWEKSHWGYYLDSTAEETAEMIRSFYGLNATVVRDYTEKNIKDALNANKIPIIVAAGQKLGNPNYRQPGPIYHMLVVRGYTTTKIITNDPGTRNGESYQYTFATLKNAAADWDHRTGTIDETKSVMIVVSK